MPITKGYQQLVAEAMAEVTTYSVAQVLARLNDAKVQIVDIRDIRELADGTVMGAFHAPRGMLEFWIDPASPYYKPIFGENKKFVFYCASAWRSALSAKTAQDMGLQNVSHLAGGFTAWKKAGGEIAAFVHKQPSPSVQKS